MCQFANSFVSIKIPFPKLPISYEGSATHSNARLENFVRACGTFADHLRSVLPEGSRKARIHFSRRETGQLSNITLGQTLGEEAQGMVVIDAAAGIPLQYESLAAMTELAAMQNNRLEIDVLTDQAKAWQTLPAPLDIDGEADLDRRWHQDIHDGAEHLAE